MGATHNSKKRSFYQFWGQGHCYTIHQVIPKHDYCLGDKEVTFIIWICLLKHGIINLQWCHRCVHFYSYWNCLASSEFSQWPVLWAKRWCPCFIMPPRGNQQAAYRDVLPNAGHSPWTGLHNFRSFSAPQQWWLCSLQRGPNSGLRTLCLTTSACAAGWVQIWWPSLEMSFCSQWPTEAEDTRMVVIFAFQNTERLNNQLNLFTFSFFFCKDHIISVRIHEGHHIFLLLHILKFIAQWSSQ